MNATQLYRQYRALMAIRPADPTKHLDWAQQFITNFNTLCRLAESALVPPGHANVYLMPNCATCNKSKNPPPTDAKISQSVEVADKWYYLLLHT